MSWMQFPLLSVIIRSKIRESSRIVVGRPCASRLLSRFYYWKPSSSWYQTRTFLLLDAPRTARFLPRFPRFVIIVSLLISSSVSCAVAVSECEECKTIVDLLQFEWGEEKTEDCVMEIAVFICETFHIEDNDVCNFIISDFSVRPGLVDLFRRLCSGWVHVCHQADSGHTTPTVWASHEEWSVIWKKRIEEDWHFRLWRVRRSSRNYLEHDDPRKPAEIRPEADRPGRQPDSSSPAPHRSSRWHVLHCGSRGWLRHAAMLSPARHECGMIPGNRWRKESSLWFQEIVENEAGVKVPAGPWGNIGSCDTPYWLLTNMLQHIASTAGPLDYVMVSGDLVSHTVWAYTPETHSFMVRNLSDTIRSYFPNTPVYFAVGNHEGVPVDKWDIFFPFLGSLRFQYCPSFHTEEVPHGLALQDYVRLVARMDSRWSREDAEIVKHMETN